jgi:hypothetical protein
VSHDQKHLLIPADLGLRRRCYGWVSGRSVVVLGEMPRAERPGAASMSRSPRMASVVASSVLCSLRTGTGIWVRREVASVEGTRSRSAFARPCVRSCVSSANETCSGPLLAQDRRRRDQTPPEVIRPIDLVFRHVYTEALLFFLSFFFFENGDGIMHKLSCFLA